MQLLGLVPTDPHILQRLGQLFDSEGDKQQAYQYYYDVSNYLVYKILFNKHYFIKPKKTITLYEYLFND